MEIETKVEEGQERKFNETTEEYKTGGHISNGRKRPVWVGKEVEFIARQAINTDMNRKGKSVLKAE